jgi:jumonji domain-containing protein 7
VTGLEIPAIERWTDEYIIERMGDREISVAVTPNGYYDSSARSLYDYFLTKFLRSRADAVTPGPNDKLYFVEPYTQKMTMQDFLSALTPVTGYCSTYLRIYVCADVCLCPPHLDKMTLLNEKQDIHYLQSQNGNMYTRQFFESRSEQAPTFEPSEFEPMRADVPSEIPWCSHAFGSYDLLFSSHSFSPI